MTRRLRKLYILSILLFVFGLGFFFPGQLLAQDKIGQVTGGTVNVRSGAGTQFSQIGQVRQGSYVTILGEQNGWFRVRLADGKIGWLAGWLIEEKNNLQIASINSSTVNIRSGPGTTFPIMVQVRAGDKLPILDTQDRWYLVKLPDGRQGWLANWLADISQVAGAQQGIVNSARANVRQGAGTNYPLLFQLNQGQQVIIKEERDGWLLIEANQRSGWIAAWLVNSPNGVQSGRSAIVAESIVNIRQEPTTQSTRVTQVNKGTKLEIIGEQGEWYKVRTASRQEGWVAGWLISLESAGEVPTSNAPSTNPPNTSTPPATPPSTGSNEEIILVTGNTVNIRQGPSINHPIVTKVTGGTELPVISRQGEWLNVRLANGGQGWIAQWLTVKKDTKPLPQPTPHYNELKLTLDNDKVLAFNNLGDKLKISLTGVDNNQYQIGRTSDGSRLIIEIRSANLRSIVQPLDNWGVKEIRISGQSVIITFDKNYTYLAKYNSNSKALEIEVTYPTEQLVPVRQIRLNPAEHQAVLQIASARRVEYTTREATPNKLVIDLPQTSLQLSSQHEAEQNANFGPIRKVSSRQLSPDMVRIEAEFAPGAQYQITQNDDYIVIGARMGGGTLAGKTIVIDPGHGTIQPGGFTDPGAIGRDSGVAEREIVLDISLKLRDMLTKQGARVIMTHTTGRTPLTLAGRAAIANDIKADIFVSVHANAHTNRAIQGTMTFYYAPTWHSELSSQRWLRQRLALFIQEELVKAGGRPDQGIKEESFAVLRETNVPSVLVETAFLTNPVEEALLNTDAFRTKMAHGIFKGIERYFHSL